MTEVNGYREALPARRFRLWPVGYTTWYQNAGGKAEKGSFAMLKAFLPPRPRP